MAVRFVFSVFFIFNHCVAFNIDTQFVSVISSRNNGDYFGFSILLQKGAASSVIVGAPKANSSTASHSKIKEPGALYKCTLENSCTQYLLDEYGNSPFTSSYTGYIYHNQNRKDGSLLGYALDGGENVGDPFVVCSPRWINERTDKNGQHYLANGMCYHIRNSANLMETAKKVMPLLPAGKQGYSYNNVVKYYYANGEVGMSVQYLQKEKELLLGAPGVLSWKGTVIRYKNSGINLPQQQRLTDIKNSQAYTWVNIPNPVYFKSLLEENAYLGYAISSGKFDINQKDTLWYVAGAPRAEELNGLVMLFEFPQEDDSDLIVHRMMVGEQMGSYFGGSLLSTDVTGNGVADLLVGAPTHSTDAWDEGCVYFYKNDGHGNFEKLKMFGTKAPGARFGTAISDLGDINRDSFRDIAISAPYEDNQGVVYIYLGNQNGVNPEYTQKLSARAISPTLRSFGYTMSKGVDIDNNLYNDVAIGAFQAGQVAVLKSRPVIKYQASLTSSVKELSVNSVNFDVTYCVSYTSFAKSVSHVDTNIQVFRQPNSTQYVAQVVTLTPIKGFCSNTTIVLKSNTIDYSKPVIVEMTCEIEERPITEFCPTCPVTDPTDSNSVTLSIPFANGCGEDNICQPELTVTANLIDQMSELVLGSQRTLQLRVNVENKNEPAYLCQVRVVLPPDVEVLRLSSKCELDEKVYTCLVDNAFQPNTHKELIFDFDIRNLKPQEELVLNVTVDSKGEESDLRDNNVVVTLPLRLESDLEVITQSNPYQILYDVQEEAKANAIVNFTHEFSVKNLGPSPIPDFSVKFDFPVGTNEEVTFDIYEPKVYLENQPMQCKADLSYFSEEVDGKSSDVNESEASFLSSRSKRSAPGEVVDFPLNRTVFANCSEFHCIHVVCTAEEIMPKYGFMKAKFNVRGHADILEKIMGNKDVMLISSVIRTAANNKTTAEYATTLLLTNKATKETVSYWIYIVCILTALAILASIIFILYKLNFFRRPTREKLHNEAENAILDDTSDCEL